MGMRWTMRCMRERLETIRSQIVVTMLSYRVVIKRLKPLNHWYLAALQHRSGRVRLPSSALAIAVPAWCRDFSYHDESRLLKPVALGGV